LAKVFARCGRKEMRDPVHDFKPAGRRVRGVESEQRDHAVYINEE
jgi:hypothetical protein